MKDGLSLLHCTIFTMYALTIVFIITSNSLLSTDLRLWELHAQVPLQLIPSQ